MSHENPRIEAITKLRNYCILALDQSPPPANLTTMERVGIVALLRLADEELMKMKLDSMKAVAE